MAGHSKFNNIKHRKNNQDSKRSAKFSKLARDIRIAVKVGNSADIETNFKLRIAIQNAKSYNVPSSVIENAIHSKDDDSDYFDMRYSGNYKKFAFIIEAKTNNKNRTSSIVKSTFSKNEGILSETGSSDFLFDYLGEIKYNIDLFSEEELLHSILDLNIFDYSRNEDSHIIYVLPDLLHKNFISCADILHVQPNSAQLIWKPKDLVVIENEKELHTIEEIYNQLIESDDIENIYVNADF